MTSAVCPTRRASEVTSADARLFRALRAATDAAPTARRTLVVPDINMGRELLATLARRTGGWIGWEVATLRSVADDLAFVPLSERGLRVAGDLELATLVDVALERATADGALDDRFAALRRGLGFRRCVRDALLELRMAGVTAEQLRQGTRAGTPSRELAAVLARYEEALAHARCTDVAGVFATALDMFDDEAPFVLDERIHIVPGLSARGLPGALADRLRARGATVLDGDAPRDTEAPDALIIAPSEANESATRLAWLAAIAAGQPLPSPDDPRVEQGTVAIDLFAAATPEDEMREVLRRAVAEGWRFDDVEIVTTDPDRYGVALAALCARLDVRASMVRGVPFARTRLGRALDRWLGWLQDGLPADVVRQALEGGELNGDDETPPGALARALRGLQVG